MILGILARPDRFGPDSAQDWLAVTPTASPGSESHRAGSRRGPLDRKLFFRFRADFWKLVLDQSAQFPSPPLPSPARRPDPGERRAQGDAVDYAGNERVLGDVPGSLLLFGGEWFSLYLSFIFFIGGAPPGVVFTYPMGSFPSPF